MPGDDRRRYLVDRSALEQRRHRTEARELLALLLTQGVLATCHVIALEVLYSARNLADYETLRTDLDALPWLPVTVGATDRALEVQRALARHGQRRLPLPDLIIAATAELGGATVLHYDHDYDVIASVTGQPTHGSWGAAPVQATAVGVRLRARRPPAAPAEPATRAHSRSGGLMGLLSVVGRTRRASIALLAVLVVTSVSAMASVARATVVPPVSSAGVGTKAALSSPECAPDGKLAYPYPQRLACTRPLKQGESNGGATSTGVTKDKIRIVLFLGTHEQQDAERTRPGASAPVDLATNQPAYFEDSFPPWQEVLGHSFNSWGREFEFVTVTPTGTDEAAQRADALTVAEKKPFAVVVNVPVTAGGGQVFAAELVAKKIIVFFGGITNEEADRQAPYRYLGGFDNNAAGVNTAIFAARQLQGGTAKWSGDFTSKKRVFGTIYPESGIDWQFFEDTAKKEGLKVAENVVYSVPLDTSEQAAKNQEEAPTLVTKLKDEGVTTVLLFTSFQMNQALFKAADALEYHPEWVFSGMGAQDIEITARILNGLAPEQMKHVFGLGNLPLYVDTINDPQRAWFNWYWGGNQGIYSAATFGTLHQLNGAVSFAGPKLTPKTFQQGMFSMPLRGGAASKQLQSFMTGLGPTPGLPYNVYSQVGLDYAIMWWNPDITGKGKILFDEGKGRFMYVDGGKRYAVGVEGAEWKKGEPKLFDPNVAIAQFEELPASDKVPEFPCKGCPSSSS